MPERELDVGVIVQFRRVAAANGAVAREYRIKQLLRLQDGATLYKIKSEAEPFHRVVCECDLDLRT